VLQQEKNCMVMIRCDQERGSCSPIAVVGDDFDAIRKMVECNAELLGRCNPLRCHMSSNARA